jgi:epoxyqueuosine reductase
VNVSASADRDDPAARAARAKALAVEAGFDRAGITRADAPPELAHFADWVASGAAGEMAYLTSQVDRRRDLRAAFPWARSILCVALQYDTPEPYSTDADAGAGWIARYAWGDDYHEVMKAMLDRVAERLRAEWGPVQARTYVDTGPIVERAYAAAAGLGAWGKNTCLLDPVLGSWFFLGEIVLDADLPADPPRTDMCGTCTACLDACPTGALPRPYFLDATRCISYLTIEQKGPIPEDKREGIGRHVFGCDICQDVCPWNRRRRQYGPAPFAARAGMVAPDLGELAGLDAAAFSARFRNSPIKRAKRRGLLRNVAVAMANSGDGSHRPTLEHLAADEDPLVREHAQWALQRLA